MSLSVEVSGQGPDLVLLHGWGLHGGLFGPLMPHLTPYFRVHNVDLPGHGRSHPLERGDLDAWVDAVNAAVPVGGTWLGWSLGGVIALRAARRNPGAFERLILVASTPRFTTADDWPHAQAPDMLQRFADDLTRDFRGTVADFLTLQSLGDEHARAQVRAVREILFAHGDPDPAALRDGLGILRDSDLRVELEEVSLPTLLIAGKRDRLTPPEAMAAMQARLPDATLEIHAGAAHAPFLTDPERFAGRIREFAHG